MRLTSMLLLLLALGAGLMAYCGNFDQQRAAMVATIRAHGVTDPKVLEVMGRVERHKFVPVTVMALAYEDSPLPIGEGQTISQPAVVALMTESLQVKPGEKVLEIGTGSGYQAAVLAELGCKVWTIEIVESLAKEAAGRLKELGYGSVQTRHGDGYIGWAEAAPFDAVIVTCAPDHIPKPLVEQLREGGRMCIPVGPEGSVQTLTMVRKKGGKMVTEDLIPVTFVPLVRSKGNGASTTGR